MRENKKTDIDPGYHVQAPVIVAAPIPAPCPLPRPVPLRMKPAVTVPFEPAGIDHVPFVQGPSEAQFDLTMVTAIPTPQRIEMADGRENHKRPAEQAEDGVSSTALKIRRGATKLNDQVNSFAERHCAHSAFRPVGLGQR